MLRKVILLLLAVLPLAAGAQPHFDYVTGEPGNRAYLRLPQDSPEVKAVLYCHQNMTEEVLFRSEAFCREMDRLGVAMAFVQRGSQNWDPATDCQRRFEALMDGFARGDRASGNRVGPGRSVRPFGAGDLPVELRRLESGADAVHHLLSRGRAPHEPVRVRAR